MLNGLKKIKLEPDDIHAKLMRNYPEVPEWWYASTFAVFFCVAVVAVEVGVVFKILLGQMADCFRFGIRRYRCGRCCSLYCFRLSIYYLLDLSML